MLSNNSMVVKVPLPHDLAGFEKFHIKNIIKCVKIIQTMLKEDLERAPENRKAATHYVRPSVDVETNTRVDVRVSNPALECEELLAILEQQVSAHACPRCCLQLLVLIVRPQYVLSDGSRRNTRSSTVA